MSAAVSSAAPNQNYRWSELDLDQLRHDAKYLRGLLVMFAGLTDRKNHDLVDWAAVLSVTEQGVDIAKRVELQATMLRELAARRPE